MSNDTPETADGVGKRIGDRQNRMIDEEGALRSLRKANEAPAAGQDGGPQRYTHAIAGPHRMRESSTGDWIRIGDYADILRERDELKAEAERLRETVDYAAEQIAGLRADNTAWREEIDRLRAENERALDVCRRIVKQWDEEETVWVGCVEDARAVLAKHAEPQS